MVLVTGLVAEANLDTLSLKLVEGIAEVAAAAHGDHIAVLALGDREAERERAGDIAATALPQRRGGQDFALAVLHGDLGVAADIRVAIRSLARCPVLGHAKASMTLDVYADLFDDDLDSVVDSLDVAIRSAADPLRTKSSQ